jgi:hypothetical protein
MPGSPERRDYQDEIVPIVDTSWAHGPQRTEQLKDKLPNCHIRPAFKCGRRRLLRFGGSMPGIFMPPPSPPRIIAKFSQRADIGHAGMFGGRAIMQRVQCSRSTNSVSRPRDREMGVNHFILMPLGCDGSELLERPSPTELAFRFLFAGRAPSRVTKSPDKHRRHCDEKYVDRGHLDCSCNQTAHPLAISGSFD